MSSPAVPNGLLSPTRTIRRKEKRNPSVTPRRFGRFFTPRPTLPMGRRILGSLDSAAVNRQPLSPQSLFSDPLTSDLSPSPTKRLESIEEGARKRRWQEQEDPIIKRRGFLPDDMPPPPLNFSQASQPLQEKEISKLDASITLQEKDSAGNRRRATLRQFFKASREGTQVSKQQKAQEMPETIPTAPQDTVLPEEYEPKPIRRFANRGFEAQLLIREHGFSSRHTRQHISTPACDPRIETANFCSTNTDVSPCDAHDHPGGTIPFCVATGYHSDITAVGDEEGYVRVFNNGQLNHFKVHDNAIMDIAFSEDDTRLVAGGGNRSASIVDVPSLTVAAKLENGHDDSLRQVSFQPGRGNGNIVATSDRAGRIQIWDLRCSSNSISAWSTVLTSRDIARDAFSARTINTLDNAHERTVSGITSSASVTAIQWFNSGRENLLLSASEANASIKLWDTRYIKSRREITETPLAVTLEPSTHTFRPYGITSLALSADSTRLYAVCKDNTVYAYSTPHLMLGHAPELHHQADKRRPTGTEGLGPMYGFKHDMFRAQSFYVKCALRRPNPQYASSELLAVGSSDSCAVLFPTDERYLRKHFAQSSHIVADAATPAPSQSFSSCSGMPTSTLPIYRSGTPLIRGHEREVTAVKWQLGGGLVTVSDDYTIRNWRQNEGKARYLRQIGEFGGERHMAGWADVADDWDDDEA
ncbi:Fc.00g049880.m01.CDS01 [Cosmosporella sp. VM-42]